MMSGTPTRELWLPPRKTGVASSLLTDSTVNAASGVTKTAVPPEPDEPEFDPVVVVGSTGGSGNVGNGVSRLGATPLVPNPLELPPLAWEKGQRIRRSPSGEGRS